ncbi:hypothetical protein P261_00839 [Lachnospiraceae bacterium TWA4]|nr:hypothetical protein P261_00839 [Lachnospiraceae bacterium TWA4]
MATMITGVLPEVHGVHSRKERALNVPTIFAKDMGKTAFIEGDSMILRTEIFPSLHPGDEVHDSDYYVYQAVLEAIDEGNEFIFAHFHVIDDLAHENGPYHEKVKGHIQTVDSYLEEICKKFVGKVLLISDHGLHEVEDGGSHGILEDGEYRKEDMTALLGVDKRYDRRIEGL